MKKYYLIYQITNKLNGMIYIGKHKTSNIDDGYMGSGLRICNAIKKYGIENFEKTILFECSSDDEMNKLEAEIVNEEFISRDDVYNLKIGGEGGWDYVNKNSNNAEKQARFFKNKSADEIKAISKKGGAAMKAKHINMTPEEKECFKNMCRLNTKKWNEANPDYFKGERNPMYGKTHSEKTRKRLSETHTGSQNSQYGKCWIYSIHEKKSIKIKSDDLMYYLNNGWVKGRKMKFD